MAAVRLPPRSDSVREREPVWTVASNDAANYGTTAAQPQLPLKAMCDMHSRPDFVCCKTLKGDDERNLLNPDVVSDICLGLADGLTVPFGLSAGLAAIASTRIVLIGGVAELVSGSISMGIGGFLAAQAERDHYRYLKRVTRQRVARSCAGELEREVTAVLGCVGLEEALCRRVAVGLMRAENEANRSSGLLDGEEEPQRTGLLQTILRALARRPKTSLEDGKLKFADDVGLTPFLLKFGEGLEEVPNSRLFTSAFTIGGAYFCGGLIPLLPYLFVDDVKHGLFWSVVVTAIILVIFGILKAYHTGASVGWKGYTSSALYTLAVGALAAGSSYAICAALPA